MKFYKKVLSCIITAAIGIGNLCFPVSAVDRYVNDIPITTSQAYGNYTYQQNSNGIIIDSYKGTEATVDIPAQINGTAVYGINTNAFYNNTSVKIITIPDSVQFIGYNAFFGCRNLKMVLLPTNLKTLRGDVFTGTACINDQTTTVKYVGTSPFKPNTKTWIVDCEETATLVSIDPNAKHIGDEAFNACYNLKSLVIPGNIVSMGHMGAANCPELSSVTLCEGIEYIDEWAFYYCPKLKKVTIPASVTFIGKQAFGYTFKDIGDDTTYNAKISGFTISGYAGTAAETYAKENGFKFINLGAAPITYTKGDVNQDGKIDISDATDVLNIYSRNAAGLTINGYKDVQLKAADVNENGNIDIQDASSILSYYSQYAAGLNPVL